MSDTTLALLHQPNGTIVRINVVPLDAAVPDRTGRRFTTDVLGTYADGWSTDTVRQIGWAVIYGQAYPVVRHLHQQEH